MKEYIVLNILGDTIIFDYRTILEDEKVFINKNNFYKGSLYYGIKYYKRHEKEIIKLLQNNYNNVLVTMRVQRLVSFKFVASIIENLRLQNLVLDFLSTIGIPDYKLFLESKYIRNIYCYYMPSGIKDNFVKKGVNVVTSSLNQITQEFLDQQDAFENDTLYYKKTVKIKKNYPELLSDIQEFLNINYNLKAIHLYVYSKELIEGIVNLVKNDESRNVIVFLHQGYDEEDFINTNFDWLREISKKCKEDYTCEFRIIYANQFLRNNLFKQLTFNNLKLISVLCVYVCVVSLIIIKSYDYIEEISVEQLRSQLIGEANLSNEDEDEDYTYYEELPDEEVSHEEEDNSSTKNKYVFNNQLGTLKGINSDVKGFLVVKGTDISYPIVQTSDNNYYLNHDIYKRKTYVGWIFYDYRNDTKGFDDNNIIYGHNMPNGTMFGSLKKVLNASWKKDPENLIIDLDKDSGTYKFEVFSIYKVDYTTDYLKVNFSSAEEKDEFIKMIRGRSSFRSDKEVTTDDTILTLSTCAGSNNKRLVVHAVLLKDEDKDE